MATLKQRVHRFNGTDYDIVHYETEASIVTYTNNSQSTVSGALDALFSGKAASSHNHAGTDINSGTVAPARLPYTYSTTDLTAGSSALTTGYLYFVYE